MQDIGAKFIGFGKFPAVADAAAAFLASNAELNTSQYTVFPGFCDVHVHFREPGFSYKETIRSGSRAAAHGGYTAVCTMPNLKPVPDSIDNLRQQIEIISRDAVIQVYPYGAITHSQQGEELSEMESISENVIAFSDDGRGVQSENIMRRAMIKACSLGKIIAAHCEDNSLLRGGYINNGKYARLHGHRGICAESEWKPIERDLRLVKDIGCAYHICHISCRKSVELIRKAKVEGLNVSCETAPHYLLLDENDLCEDGNFKMNPPLRSADDRKALIDGIIDGTIDMIATDHAPHSMDEKSRGLEKSAFGIVGLETAFSLLYTELVMKNIITFEKLIDLMAVNPRKRFNIPIGEDFTIWRLGEKHTINAENFLSLGRSTPFSGKTVFGRCCTTVCNGRPIYKYI